MAPMLLCHRYVVGVIYLQFESKENKIIIESFSRVYVEPLEEYEKAHAWKVCVPSQVPWVRIPLSPPLIFIIFFYLSRLY